MVLSLSFFFFFFQAEDGIRDVAVTGVQTCALPISALISPAQVKAEGDAGKIPHDGVVHLDAAFQVSLRAPALGFVEAARRRIKQQRIVGRVELDRSRRSAPAPRLPRAGCPPRRRESFPRWNRRRGSSARTKSSPTGSGSAARSSGCGSCAHAETRNPRPTDNDRVEASPRPRALRGAQSSDRRR